MTSQTHSRKTLKIGAALVTVLMATTALTGTMTASHSASAGQPVVVATKLAGSFSKLVAETRPAVVSILVTNQVAGPNMTSGEVRSNSKNSLSASICRKATAASSKCLANLVVKRCWAKAPDSSSPIMVTSTQTIMSLTVPKRSRSVCMTSACLRPN